MNTLEFLQSKGIDTVFCINPFVVSDKRETELKPEHQVRGVTEKELIIELDIEDGFDTPELRQSLYELQLKNFDRLSAQGFEVYLFNHKGKCPHIRLYNFEGMNKQNQESYYLNFVQKFCEPRLEHTKYDKSFYASFHWCPIEFHSHYKYGTIYELEKFGNVGSKNIVDASLITDIKEEGKRKVELDYLQILSKVDATEQERVSCVMQIHEKMKLNKDETMGFISKHSKWTDFNPILTAQKLDHLWKYTEKENPLKQKETTSDEIIQTKGMVSFYSIRKLLKNQHDHLRLFERIDNKLGLEGEKYYTTKKWLAYFYESKIQRATQIKIGSGTYDNRCHALIIATAGKGKGVIKNNIKQVFKLTKEDVMEASGLVHPEQLIGKTKYVGRGKERHAVENKGYLAAEILLHDETNATINETAPNADQSMRIKRTAMDCFGYNQIGKKLVDDTSKDMLEYNPTSRCIDFMHPEQFQNCFFDKGTYRRYVCFELGNDKQISIEDSIKSITDESVDYSEERDLLQALTQETRRIHTDFKMNDDCKNIAGKWILLWNGFLLNNEHPALRRFGEMTFYSIKDYFFKYIAILHGAYKKDISESYLTHLACIDTVHFLLDTVENYCKYGDLANTSDVWRGAKGMEIRVLEYLWRRGAISLDASKVSVKDYLGVISELFGVQERQAQGILSNLKSRQYVGSKQVGQTDSRVWITFEPEISKIALRDIGFEEFWGEKNEGCKECSMYSHLGICTSLEYFSTRINPIINKNKNNIKEDLSLFNKNKVSLNFFSQSGGFENGLNCANNQVSSTPCTPCTPEPKIEIICGSLASTIVSDLKKDQAQAIADEASLGKVCQVCGMREAVEEFDFNEVVRWLCVDCLVRAKELAVRRSALKSNSV